MESAAVDDFLRRIAHYTVAYSPLDSDGSEGEFPYIKARGDWDATGCTPLTQALGCVCGAAD